MQDLMAGLPGSPGSQPQVAPGFNPQINTRQLATNVQANQDAAKSAKNDMLAQMLMALGGVLRGDKNFVQNTMAIQNMQEGKKKEEERKKRFDDLIAKTPEGSLRDLMVTVGSERIDTIAKQIFESQQPVAGTLTAGRKDAEYFATLTPEQQRQFLIASGRLSPELAVEFREAKAQGGKDLTPGQIQVDKKFADTLVAWNTGEKQQADNNITNLDNKIERLISGKENLSGREFAFIPDMLKPVFRPVATGFLDEISDVTYQSLRATLGAQFTENEGKKLIAATFNQNLPEEQNIIRLQRLSAKIKAIRDSKERSIDYFNKNGTLQGYTEEPQSFDDILDSILFEEFQTLSVEEITDSYAKASTAPERQSILRFIKILKEQAKEQGQE